jgi:hypothetical protein
MRLLIVNTEQTVSCSRLQYWLVVFILVRCEIFAYPSTVTHEPLKLNYKYFSELV